jgi:hypothetical protein
MTGKIETLVGTVLGVKIPHVIERYRKSCWLDKKRNEPVFGIDVHIKGVGWCRLAYDSKPYLERSAAEVEKEIARLKKERKS